MKEPRYSFGTRPTWFLTAAEYLSWELLSSISLSNISPIRTDALSRYVQICELKARPHVQNKQIKLRGSLQPRIDGESKHESYAFLTVESRDLFRQERRVVWHQSVHKCVAKVCKITKQASRRWELQRILRGEEVPWFTCTVRWKHGSDVDLNSKPVSNPSIPATQKVKRYLMMTW